MNTPKGEKMQTYFYYTMKKQTSEDFSKRLDELDPQLYEMEFKHLTVKEVRDIEEFNKFVKSDSTRNQVSKCGKYCEDVKD